MPIDSVPRILVVGGAGFIGSHMVLALNAAGYAPIVIDNLSKGHRDAVIDAPLFVGDMADEAFLEAIFQSHTIRAVMHFASFIEVGESVREPLLYYQNNVSATLSLLKVMLRHGVRDFVFSSTAAVYGEPQYTPIDEAHPLRPINPYGSSKWMVESILRDLGRSHGLRFSILRYFNAAGADPLGRVFERHEPESHLIPLALQAAMGLRPNLHVFGRDYPTPDGTCVRDYVHVADLCDAHLLALKAMQAGRIELTCNLGTGTGYSVQAVIDAVMRVTQRSLNVVDTNRRPGDPAVLVADAGFAKCELGWQPRFTDLDMIVRHGWQRYAQIGCDSIAG